MARALFLALVLVTCLPAARAGDKPLSLEDLGFKKNETKGDPDLQVRLEQRTSMLKTHQTLGLITTVPMIAQVFLANGVNHNVGRRNLHMGVGIATTGLYAASASFAIFAPKPDGIEDKGNSKIHRALAWVHGPLMVATPILGALAYSQLDHGERVHGIAGLHGAAAMALIVSYVASLAVMSFDF